MGVYSRLVESGLNRPSSANDDDGSRASSERPPAGLGELVSNVGLRIQEILDSAERAAAEIRTEAEAATTAYLEARRREADRLVEDRINELGTLTQSLSARAATVEREAAALISELEEARRRMAGVAPVGAPAPAPDPLSAPAPAPAPAPPPAPASVPLPRIPSPAAPGVDNGSSERIPEQAVLRATQMAVAGSERTEIESMLRVEFGIQDPMSVVDQMLRSERA